MKRHKTLDDRNVMGRLVDEFNNIKDLRFLSIIAHLYVEYFLNEIICRKLKEPSLIIDDKELGEFHNKFAILKSMGFFEEREDLEQNIILLNRIRNFYAHNMITNDKIPDEVRSRINKMRYLEESETFDDEIPSDIENKFHLTMISTIVLLSNLISEI